jgi:tRNA threonylcarbamoyl adenosine modification protein YeaZ
MIDQVLGQAEVDLDELDGLIALTGPGSFTGIRIGLGTIYGLHQALEVPAKGISSLQTLAALAPRQGSTIVAVVNALRGDWFVQSFEPGKVPEALGHPSCLTSQALQAQPPPLLIGHGAPAQLGSLLGNATDIIEPGSLAPTALSVAGLPGPHWDADTLTKPLYLRRPAVTLQRDSPLAAKT